MIDYEAHWQALYDEMRAALDVNFAEVPIYHITSTDDATGEPADPPYVVYRQETERTMGTTGGGNSKVMKSGWVITARDFDLAAALAYISDIVGDLTEADDSMVTADGYATTDIKIIGLQSLYEQDFGVYAVHCRIDWERSR